MISPYLYIYRSAASHWKIEAPVPILSTRNHQIGELLIGLGKLLSISIVALLRGKKTMAQLIYPFIISLLLYYPQDLLFWIDVCYYQTHTTLSSSTSLVSSVPCVCVYVHIKYIHLIRAIEWNETEWESLSFSRPLYVSVRVQQFIPNPWRCIKAMCY
jgi:hypothetical protein